jgi:hypothetical protein
LDWRNIMINIVANDEYQVHHSPDLCIIFEEFDRDSAETEIHALIKQGYKVMYSLDDEDNESAVYLRRSN